MNSSQVLVCMSSTSLDSLNELTYICLSVKLGNEHDRVYSRGTWNASGQYEYYVSPGGDSRSYDEAQAYCNGQDGELALVKTQEVQLFIQTLVVDNSGQPYGFFIGLRDIGANGTFVWNDGEALSYKNWYTGEPNNFDETCVTVGWIYTYQANLPWYSVPCTTGANGPRGFVCQRLVVSDSTTVASSCYSGFTFEPISFIIGLLIPAIIFVAVSVKFYLIYKKLLGKLSQPQQEVRYYENIESTVQQSSSQEASHQYENILHKPTGS